MPLFRRNLLVGRKLRIPKTFGRRGSLGPPVSRTLLKLLRRQLFEILFAIRARVCRQTLTTNLFPRTRRRWVVEIIRILHAWRRDVFFVQKKVRPFQHRKKRTRRAVTFVCIRLSPSSASGVVSTTTKMIEILKKLKLDVDILLDTLIREENLEEIISRCRCPQTSFGSLLNQVPLNLVRDEKILKVARKYISRLLGDTHKYGYLYFLSSKRLIVPLNIQLHAKTVIQCCWHGPILQVIHHSAKEFACEHTVKYQITCLELLYFFVRLMNREFSWISVDYLLQGAVRHALLVGNPTRRLDHRTLNCRQAQKCSGV